MSVLHLLSGFFSLSHRHDSEKISRTFRNWANYQIIKIVEIENKHSCDKVLFISAFESNFTICLIHYSDMIGTDIEINIKEEFSEHSEILEPQKVLHLLSGFFSLSLFFLIFERVTNSLILMKITLFILISIFLTVYHTKVFPTEPYDKGQSVVTIVSHSQSQLEINKR
jgi:hypothetical protein